jgi:hypothetical protein
MKKSLLLIAVFIISISSFAQATSDASLDAMSYTDGKTYSPVNPFTVAQGGYILMGGNGSYTGADYWDLSNYNGLEMKLTCSEASVGQYMAVRFIMVGTGGAQSIIKTFTFTSTSQVVSLDFTADGAQSKNLWAIKMPWDGNLTGSYSITIDYLKAKAPGSTTGVTDVKADNPSEFIDVYNVSGALVKKNVKRSDALEGLSNGLYMVGGKKISVNRR